MRLRVFTEPQQGATYDQILALPKPVQQPHPPVIVGGGGPARTPRLAARCGARSGRHRALGCPGAVLRHDRGRGGGPPTAKAGADTIYRQVVDLDDLDHVALVAEDVAPLLGP